MQKTSFYALSKEKKGKLTNKIEEQIVNNLNDKRLDKIIKYSSDSETYIRKATYLAIGRHYKKNQYLRKTILETLNTLFDNQNEKVRQTAINALGEIGKIEAREVLKVFEKALLDKHHIVRNAVIGSLKKMGEVNPKPVLSFAKKYLHHPDYHVRRQVIHGMELRGRTHPEEVLPLLKEVQFEQNRTVRNIIIHVLGQISYKRNCLKTVILELKTWQNKELVENALKEILETHKSYEKFSALSYNQAKKYIQKHV